MSAAFEIFWNLFLIFLAGIGITLALYILAILVIACVEKIKEEVQKNEGDN